MLLRQPTRAALLSASRATGHAQQQRMFPATAAAVQRRQRPGPCRAESLAAGPAGDGSASSHWLVGDHTSDVIRKDYDAILVLGGGLLPDGRLPPWVERRLEGAAHIYRRQRGGSPCPVLLLGAGTPHKRPVLDAAGYVLHESTAYASYLMRRGLPAADLLKETSSYDTVGNAYFSATMHAVPAAWRRLAVVTSAFHMPRTRALFDACYALAGRHHASDPALFSLDYHPVSDEGLFDEAVLSARADKEAAAVAAWRAASATLTTLPQLHAWLFATHLCYSVSRQHEFGREAGLDPRLAATY